MDMNELKTFIETEEGAAWLESQKAPLVAKRNELLGEIKTVNGRLASEAQRAADAAKLLEQERASVSHLVVDQELGRLLERAGVLEVLAGILAELKAGYAPTVKADGLARKAVAILPGADGKPEEVSLEEMVTRWTKTPGAKVAIRAPGSTGGGAQGGAGATSTMRSMPLDNFEQMAPAQRMAFIQSGGQVL